MTQPPIIWSASFNLIFDIIVMPIDVLSYQGFLTPISFERKGARALFWRPEV